MRRNNANIVNDKFLWNGKDIHGVLPEQKQFWLYLFNTDGSVTGLCLGLSSKLLLDSKPVSVIANTTQKKYGLGQKSNNRFNYCNLRLNLEAA